MPKNKLPVGQSPQPIELLQQLCFQRGKTEATFTSQKLANAIKVGQPTARRIIKNWIEEGVACFVGRLQATKRMDGVEARIPTYRFTDEGLKRLKEKRLVW